MVDLGCEREAENCDNVEAITRAIGKGGKHVKHPSPTKHKHTHKHFVICYQISNIDSRAL